MSKRQPRQAIALSYDGQQAPTLSAKGDDELAEAILALAREHEVPIYENAELVRLLARLELGEQIPEPQYLTIAEINAFAWQLRGKVPVGFDDEPAGERDITPAAPHLLPGPRPR